jgi:hypothetical protein
MVQFVALPRRVLFCSAVAEKTRGVLCRGSSVLLPLACWAAATARPQPFFWPILRPLRIFCVVFVLEIMKQDWPRTTEQDDTEGDPIQNPRVNFYRFFCTYPFKSGIAISSFNYCRTGRHVFTAC